MKKILKTLFLTLSLTPGFVCAQAPSESEDVMLQGFYWDSQQVTGWAQLSNLTEDIARHFTLVWLPPSANAEGASQPGGNNVGYHPRQWDNQTSCWGTADELKQLIQGLHQKGVKAIADIVINHRAGDNDWGIFTPDNFGAYGQFQLTAEHICSSDEMNTDPLAGKWNGLATGAPDTGENWGGARDLDHTSPYVQNDCKAYLQWMKEEMGYDGWRYDFVKGYEGRFVGIYNRHSQPYLSVGEYWDGSYDKVAAWIDATDKESMAFDFPMKYAALNEGLARADYSKMAWLEDNTTWRPAGMIHHHKYNRYAVTFVDNHDSYRDGNKFTGYVEQAYAFILSSPGVPCVFWPHWQSASRVAIEQMIAARRAAGIHSQSDVTVTQRDKYYESVSVGHRGTMLTRIGFAAPRDVPDGYHLCCNGSNWWMYLSDNLSEISAVTSSFPTIWVSASRLCMDNSANRVITVYTAEGRLVMHTSASYVSQKMPRGCYLVKVGENSQKVVL